MLIWSNWSLFWKKNYATITISLTLWKIQNLGAPSPTFICNLTPCTWNCQHMHVHLVRTYKVFQCLRHYFINFILIVRHKSNMLMLGVIFVIFCLLHCVKSVQIWSFFWSLFSCIQAEYRKIWTRKNTVFGHFSHSARLRN